jgi:hypothetical protein
MKSIINKDIYKYLNRYIKKNRKRHCIHFSYFQENIWYNKKDSYSFQDKEHHYYDKSCNTYHYFNGKMYAYICYE